LHCSFSLEEHLLRIYTSYTQAGWRERRPVPHTLNGLIARLHEHLVDSHVRRLRHGVHHRVANVLWLEHLVACEEVVLGMGAESLQHQAMGEADLSHRRRASSPPRPRRSLRFRVSPAPWRRCQAVKHIPVSDVHLNARVVAAVSTYLDRGHPQPRADVLKTECLC